MSSLTRIPAESVGSVVWTIEKNKVAKVRRWQERAIHARLPAWPQGSRRRAHLTGERLGWVYLAHSEIEFEGPFQLLVATILSAQSTDRMANRLTRLVLSRFPDPAALAGADRDEIEIIVRPIGFYKTKAKRLVAASQKLVENYGGHVPPSMAELLTLPGIGRKSANVILGSGFGLPGVVTDRHVIRVARRLCLVSTIVPQLVEGQLQRLLPRQDWTPFSLRMTLHGRYVCLARRPRCQRCVLNDFCPSSTTTDWPMETRVALSHSLHIWAERRSPSPIAETSRRLGALD